MHVRGRYGGVEIYGLGVVPVAVSARHAKLLPVHFPHYLGDLVRSDDPAVDEVVNQLVHAFDLCESEHDAEG